MDNEVVIHVRTKNDSKAGFESIGKDADAQATKIGASFAEKLANGIRSKFGQMLAGRLSGSNGPADAAGRELGDRIGSAAARRITDRISESLRRGRNGDDGRATSGASSGGLDDHRVTVDVDRQSLLQRFLGAGKDAAIRFGDGFRSMISAVFEGDLPTKIIKTFVGLLAAPAVIAPIGAAITSAVGLALTGGAIGLGIAGAFKDPRIKEAAKGLKTELGKIFEDFSAPFKPVVEEFLAPSNGGGGGLIGVLKQVSPMVSQLGKDLAPVADKLGDGILGMLQNMLPPILRATDKLKPVIESLAEKLPGFGADVGEFFETISEGAPEAALFLGHLIEVLGEILSFTGKVILGMTKLYGYIVRWVAGVANLLATVAEVAAASFQWVPGLGPKLDAAANKARSFSNRVNGELKKIDRNVDIYVAFHVAGQGAARAAIGIAKQLRQNMATGGITGAATGGIHGGMRMVGEHGPELVDLPPGSRVHSNPDTERMLSGAGGGMPPLVVQLVMDSKVVAQQLVEPTRELVRKFGQGDVQRYLGVA